ncbi:MAG: site-2 protease family protein, partial [bacterium]|nr:site-2 protease family protein [bacterium]
MFVHEIGHLVTAKKAGLRVDEFGFGFPPRLFGIRRLAGGKDGAAKTWRLIWGQPKKEAENNFGTIYSVNWIPLGGFVKIYGQDGEGGEDKKSFAAQKPGRRVLILLAGVTMNVILAAFLFCVGFFIGLPQEITAGNEARARDIKIQIIDVAADSPAKLAGLKLGDSMLKISESKGGESLVPAKIEDVQNFTQKYLGSVLNLEVRRGAEIVRLEVLARENYPQNQAPMGIALARTGIVSFPWYQNIWEGIKTTVI